MWNESTGGDLGYEYKLYRIVSIEQSPCKNRE